MIKKSDLSYNSFDINTRFYLALWKDENYIPSNTYIPSWGIHYTEYLLKHRIEDLKKEYCGWMKLEDAVKDNLQTGLPNVIDDPILGCNVVLAKSMKPSEHILCSDWIICNSIYYNFFPHSFAGFIELEYIPSPVFTPDQYQEYKIRKTPHKFFCNSSLDSPCWCDNREDWI